MMSRRTQLIVMSGVLLLAFGLRVWQLQEMPPGWRDDELINSLVISQKVLDGEWAVYYPDASGHEALYHALNAGMLGLFGANGMGIRLLSAYLGVLTVALTYRVAKEMLGVETAVFAAAALSVSFWSLMYSRIGLRHVLTPPLMLGTVWFFWRGWFVDLTQRRGGRRVLIAFAIAGLFMALGMYTYFASRGVPLIMAAVAGYGAVTMWPRFRERWRGVVLMFGVTAVLSLPLLITLRQQPEQEARVAELAVPLVEAQSGNYEPLRDHVVTTLSMFHADGDDEWLYNIPHRPVFVWVTAVLFWGGVVTAVLLTLRQLWYRFRNKPRAFSEEKVAYAGAFLFAWWLAGISPGFISVPPASLGHTILAQPAVFILLALPVGIINCQLSIVNVARRDAFARQLLMANAARRNAFARKSSMSLDVTHSLVNRQSLTYLFTVIIVIAIAVRDLPDYFESWPERGLVRFLYRADIRDVAEYVNENEVQDFGVTGLLAGPWDKLALEIDLETEARPRWVDPQRAVLLNPPLSFAGFPDVPQAFEDAYVTRDVFAGYYWLADTAVPFTPLPTPICFENGLCAISAEYDESNQRLTLGWEVERPLDLPPNPLISNPPPPGVYSGPRLAVFAQLFDAEDNFLSGDDGLWVDPYTLYEQDRFLQQHWLSPGVAEVEYALFGLYDPMTGQRVLTTNGADHVRIEIR